MYQKKKKKKKRDKVYLTWKLLVKQKSANNLSTKAWQKCTRSKKKKKAKTDVPFFLLADF